MRSLTAPPGLLPTDQSIAVKVLDLIQAERLPVGSHLPAQWLALKLRVSRTPINGALALLTDKGMLSHRANRGYFLARDVEESGGVLAEALGIVEEGAANAAYFRIAEDRLSGALPSEVPEKLLRTRYGLTSAQLTNVLARISNEGWAERKPGYGWSFTTMLTTADSLLQSYRLRLALEPAALLDPKYLLAPDVLARCRAAELHLLNGGIDTDSPDALHRRGVRFHESLVEGSGNPFFIDTIRRVNRVRRLLSYRSMQDRSRYKEHCQQHLHLLDLLEQERNEEASQAMHDHLSSTLRNLQRIRDIL